MIYLACSVLLGSFVTLLFKVTDKLKLRDQNLILVNYFLASAVSIGMTWKDGFYDNYFTVIKTSEPLTIFTEKTVGNSYLLLLLVGLLAGIMYIVDLFNTKNSVVYNGAGITALFGKFGFLLSTTAAILIWREIPHGLQIPGIVLAVIALLIASGNISSLRSIKRPALLAALVIMGGGMELCSKCAVYYSMDGFNDLFVSTTFPTAFILSAGYTAYSCIKEKRRFTISFKEILLGLCLGLPNVSGSYLSLKALETVPANILFPTTAAGNLVVVSLAGILLFKESVTKKQALAIVLMVVSLVLINI